MSSRPLRRLVFAAALSLVLPLTTALAAVPNRLGSLAGSTRTALPRSIPPRARVASDLGQMPMDRTLSSVTLHFNMTDAQQTALTRLTIDQQDPHSPRYHQWLTPEVYGAQFGLSAADLAKVQAWLTSQGLRVTAVAPSANFITVSGTVSQIQTAFNTSLHILSTNGEQHFSNITDPALPSNLTPLVNGITGLNDFKLKPRVIHPNFTSSATGNHYIAPGDFYTIYDETPLLSSSINGSGVTIAIVGQTDILLSDVTAFRSASGLSTNLPTVRLIGADPGTSKGDIYEATLDVEWAGAVAPSAKVLYVNSTDVIGTSLINAITSNLAPIVSISYGACEVDFAQANLVTLNQYFQQANVQGQTIVGPGGDSGATDCDYQSTVAADGLAVDFPASSSYVTGVGGTMFNEGSATGATSFWSGSSSLTSGPSALGYIPEAVWNETSSTNGLAAGGGGVSAFFAKPAWQIGNGVPSDLSRDVPDISLNAASLHDGYLYCVQGSCVNGYRAADSTLAVVGGTSVGTPSFAGILALVEQKTGSRLGNANPQIYGLANSTFYNNVFHDITTGNNSEPCVQGSPNCPNGGSIGYSANPGYDLATGWGTIDAFNLVNTWGTVASSGLGSTTGSNLTKTVVTTSAATCGISGGSLAVAVNVSSAVASSVVPTGTVQFLVDNVAVGSPLPLANGAATYTLNTSTLTSGGHTVSAVYTGDTTFSGSKGSLVTDVVSGTLPDFSITPCVTPSVSVASGATAAGITFSVNPFNGFTGPVTLSATSDVTFNASYTFSVTPVTISGTGSGTSVFTLSAYQTNGKTTTGMVKFGQNTASLGGRHTLYTAGGGVVLASLLLLTLPRRRRWGALLAVLLTVGALGANGCGSGSTTIPASTITPTPTTTPASPGTYTVTIVGVGAGGSGTRVHSAQVTFIVH